MIITPPLYHWLPPAADDVSVTLPPSQKPVALPAVMVGDDAHSDPAGVTERSQLILNGSSFFTLSLPAIKKQYVVSAIPVNSKEVSIILERYNANGLLFTETYK